MCLEMSGSVHIQFNRHDETKVYKVIVINNKSIMSAWQKYKWHPGWNNSNRLNNHVSLPEHLKNEISLGFHVFLTKTEAEYHRRSYIDASFHIQVITLKAKKEDLVATGYFGAFKNAVFTKLYLPQSECDRLIR